jgi:uncharacterized protein involved in exopolysaccharide biosynthesis
MRAIQGTPKRSVGMDSTGASTFPTEVEEEAMRALIGMASSSINPENGLMSISVTAGNPVLAAELANSFLQHLSERVTTIRTEKARRNVAFIEEEFAEAERELRTAEERLATFMDRNQGISSERLRTEQERLQRQVQFKSDLYNELQTQLTQAQIELQRSEPIVTIVEEPVPPSQRSSPQRKLIVLISLVLGGVLGVTTAFVRLLFSGHAKDQKQNEKMQEIRATLLPDRFRTES